MTDIVNSLFNLPSGGARQQLYNEQQDFSTKFANTYADESDKRNALLGGMVGNTLANIGASLFGVQDPRLQRATTIEGILQQTQQELGADANDPAKLYPAIYQKFIDNNLTQEAMQVQQAAQKAIQEGALNTAKVDNEYAQSAKYRAESAIKQQEVAREETLRAELSKLPASATDEEINEVVRRFAPAKDVMNVIEKKQLAKEARLAKTEDLQTKLEADAQRATERNQTLLEQARMQGATSRELAQMRIASNEAIAIMKTENARAIAESKAAAQALNKGFPKDIAEAEATLTGINMTLDSVATAQKLIKDKKVSFGIKENSIANASLLFGNPTENALAQNEVKRKVNEGVNQVLLAAKGTQTEGDANRAKELFIAAQNKNSTEAWSAALDALVEAQKKLKAEKQTYISKRGFSQTPSNANNDPLGIRK